MKHNRTNEAWIDDMMDSWSQKKFDNSQGEVDIDLVLQECLEALQAKDLEHTKDIDKLATFIMENVEGEPSQDEGVIDCAIRIMKNYKEEKKKLLDEIMPALDDFSAAANSFIKKGMEKTGQEIHENIGFIKSKFLL